MLASSTEEVRHAKEVPMLLMFCSPTAKPEAKSGVETDGSQADACFHALFCTPIIVFITRGLDCQIPGLTRSVPEKNTSDPVAPAPENRCSFLSA